MAIQEKIWGVVDAEGQFLEGFPTRQEAREVKQLYNRANPFMLHAQFELPVAIVQYKRWKKAS